VQGYEILLRGFFLNRNCWEIKMKSGLLAAVAVSGIVLAGPALAQGVKIGILNDQSGVYADYGGKWSFEAAKMAVEDFGGEVLGHKIEVISADHQNKPDLGAAIARRWYDVEGVDMITELTTSSVALAIHELSKEKKKIDIVVGAATSRLTGDACQPYGFHWAYDTHALAVGTGGYYGWANWQKSRAASATPARATTAMAELRDINFAVNAAGEIAPAEQVSVRPEINGML